MGAHTTALAPRMSDPDERYTTDVDLDNDSLFGDHDSFDPVTVERWVEANLGGTIVNLGQSTIVLTRGNSCLPRPCRALRRGRGP